MVSVTSSCRGMPPNAICVPAIGFTAVLLLPRAFECGPRKQP
jgi:hypothetical protein